MADFSPMVDDEIIDYDGDFGVSLDDYTDVMYDESNINSFSLFDRLQLLQSCSVDVVLQTVTAARFLVLAAFACHLSSILVKFNAQKTDKSKKASVTLPLLLHVVFGVLSVWIHFDSIWPVFSLITEAIGFFALNRFFSNIRLRNYTSIGFIVAFTSFLEYGLFLPELWHSIRGCHMILAMKLISVMDTGVETKTSDEVDGNGHNFSDLLAFLAYCASPATIVYGPWISMESFLSAIENATFGFGHIFHIIKSALFGLICLLCSTCFLNGILFSDDQLPKHLIGVRDSYSFILSHFFVSYLSTVIATAGGMTSVSRDLASRLSTAPAAFIQVSRPFDVLVPHSLTALVVAWSLPMHAWLRRYVFRPTHRLLGPLAGVLATYSASALLHGFNAQIAVVLLTVGLFTYVEFRLRSRLAKAFDACVGSRPCEDGGRDCHHAHDLDDPLVRSVNVAFSFYAVGLFAYATACFGGDSEHGQESVGYSWRHLLTVWSSLGWFGHVLCLATFIFDRLTA